MYRLVIRIQADIASRQTCAAHHISRFFDPNDKRHINRSGGNRKVACAQRSTARRITRLTV
jgi:hypothetical protein